METKVAGGESMASRLAQWARRFRRDGVSLWFAMRNPAVRWPARVLGAFVVAYALSPIDLIPDFVPVLGYLDEVLLLPGLIWLAIRLIPVEVLADCRRRADEWLESKGRPTVRAGIALVLVAWIAAAWVLWRWLR